MYLVANLDDIFMRGPHEYELQIVGNYMAKNVELRSEPSVERFLGIRIPRKRGEVSISSSHLIDSVTRRFFMDEAETTPTPLASRTKIVKDEYGK